MCFKGMFTFIFLLLFSTACRKSENRFPDTKIGGHACAGLSVSNNNYHDNSLEAYKYARSFEGVEVIEVDVQLSKNGTLWLFHDRELSDQSSGTGAVAQVEDSYLSTLKYRSLEKEKLIRLEDLPADLKGLTLQLDLKESDGTTSGFIDSTTLLQALIQAQSYFSNGNLEIISNSGRFVPTMKSLGFTVYLDAINAAYFFNHPMNTYADGASFRNSEITDSDVNSIKFAGKKVIIYDVRSATGIVSAFEKKPTVLLTDDIKATLIEKYK
ncbi:glycerophosphodiester phosphodiesterase [Fluviicola taffensis]|uniref:GP-PDE domain-containing protein n=1 Tax=Fluviicola taffensis (strain DSM 16823 / NCIMB 13979 / RW262) TaxID=755732 RepID=F2IA80_FLUTR|nr:glycerophosphodiester phosphodiesterase family protein [Fluviicola taffensis]AEA45257.1 hypothetical protein Fluta_3285 [Fluviicola taffensis DSM 16823]